MNNSNEKLSVVLDMYSDDEVCQSALDDVVNDVNLQYRMRRYQMIGDAMRHELPVSINLDLNHQIMSAVRKINRIDIPEYSRKKISIWNWGRLRPFVGVAVAASVAVVSVMLFQPVSIEVESQPTGNSQASAPEQKIKQLAALPVQGSAVVVSSRLNEGTRWATSEDSPALQQKLNAYLVNHTEYSMPIQSLIPQARVAGFDAQR